MATDNKDPDLAPPGAGIPTIELWIARFIFRRFCKTHSHEECSQLLLKHTETMCSLAKNCSEEEGQRQVLIKRMAGLEDSSRNWSVFMTLEHVRIVNEAVAAGLPLLLEGHLPEEEANTATVKPDMGISSEVIELLKRTNQELIENANQVHPHKPTTTFDHPWFGPLNAAEWLALTAFHMGLHLKQVKAILVKLR